MFISGLRGADCRRSESDIDREALRKGAILTMSQPSIVPIPPCVQLRLGQELLVAPAPGLVFQLKMWWDAETRADFGRPV